MPIFETWDIVKVPFPYVERPVVQRRPALVLAAVDPGSPHALLWVAMITSAANRGWPGDLAISELAEAGLPIASIVRLAKLTTIEASEAERLGGLPRPDRQVASRYLRQRLDAVLALAN